MECFRRRISDGMQDKEQKLAKDFPSIRQEMRSVHSPRTVTDKYGRIIVWILPNILPIRIQVRLLSLRRSSSQHLQALLEECTGEIAQDMSRTLAANACSKSWRFARQYFRKLTNSFPPGILNFSAAWFMLGREVRVRIIGL